MIGLKVFQTGNDLLNKQKAEEEEKKKFTLRGGSAGCLLDDYTYIGNCPYAALARYMGYDNNKQLQQGYFDGGIGNEYIWERNATAFCENGLHPDFNAYKCEEDIPVKYLLDGKHSITGRPDLVLGNKEGDNFTPKHGLELKAAFGVNSGTKRLFGLSPDPKHLCQAGFYAKVMGCNWSLVYNVYGTGDLNYFDRKEYGRTKNSLGMVEFPLTWKENWLYYILPSGEQVKTVITWEGILNYYRLIVEMYEKKKLVEISNCSLEANGEEMPFDLNDYNDFTAMVPTNHGWDEFVNYCERRHHADRFIKYLKGKYLVFDIPQLDSNLYIAEGSLITSYHTKDQARKVAYREV